ncbi:MAG: energy transducer TonB [Dysgonamonadaceae bacterium]|jgi:hypothetical protein|nr:energy transducer TonB [Dysgonamonadaceae bacterium]
MKNRTKKSNNRLIIFSITALYILSSLAVEGKTFEVAEFRGDTIFYRDAVDKLPEFPGGQTAMDEFFSETLRLSRDTLNENWQVSVHVWFIVRKTGEITNISMIHDFQDERALCVVETLPTSHWIPAEYKGEKVNVSFGLYVPYYTQIPKNERDWYDILWESHRGETEFPGGQSALKKWTTKQIYAKLSSNEPIIRLQLAAHPNFPSGNVLVDFFIERDGSITDVELIESLDPYLDEIVLQVVEAMPRWNPGRSRGQPFRARFTLSFEFQFDKSEQLNNVPIIINIEQDPETALSKFYIRQTQKP